MAIHNFNYNYTYISCKAVPKSQTDNTLIVREVTIQLDAVDQADSSKTISLTETTSVDYLYLRGDTDLPNSFISIDDITNQQMIDWFLEKTSTEILDGFCTWKLYGAGEVDPVTEPS